MAYPDTDGEISGYVAAIRYDGSDTPLRLPGWHLQFADALARARRISAALLAAGETGLSGYVTHGGERPVGFPHCGVPARGS